MKDKEIKMEIEGVLRSISITYLSEGLVESSNRQPYLLFICG
jgi:hypothetical protein